MGYIEMEAVHVYYVSTGAHECPLMPCDEEGTR